MCSLHACPCVMFYCNIGDAGLHGVHRCVWPLGLIACQLLCILRHVWHLLDVDVAVDSHLWCISVPNDRDKLCVDCGFGFC